MEFIILKCSLTCFAVFFDMFLPNFLFIWYLLKIHQYNCFDFQMSLTLSFCFFFIISVFCSALNVSMSVFNKGFHMFALLPPSGCVELMGEILFHCFCICFYLPPVVVVFC